jgi:hypothetical protein
MADQTSACIEEHPYCGPHEIQRQIAFNVQCFYERWLGGVGHKGISNF